MDEPVLLLPLGGDIDAHCWTSSIRRMEASRPAASDDDPSVVAAAQCRAQHHGADHGTERRQPAEGCHRALARLRRLHPPDGRPDRGVDVAAKEEIYRLIHETTRGGTSVIVCSSELPELMRLADRVVIMHNRRIVRCVDTAGSDIEELIRESITGSTTLPKRTETQ